MFVTTACRAPSSRKVPSLSSASTTNQSPLSHTAPPPISFSSPPTMNDGRRPASISTRASIEDVVVLPWVPATATVRRTEAMAVRISARRSTRRPRSRAATTSGLVGGMAVEMATASIGVGEVGGVVADDDLDTVGAQPLEAGPSLRSLPVTRGPIGQHRGDGAHARAADPHDVDVGDAPQIEVDSRAPPVDAMVSHGRDLDELGDGFGGVAAGKACGQRRPSRAGGPDRPASGSSNSRPGATGRARRRAPAPPLRRHRPAPGRWPSGGRRVALGSGTRTAARPTTASSATARCAAAAYGEVGGRKQRRHVVLVDARRRSASAPAMGGGERCDRWHSAPSRARRSRGARRDRGGRHRRPRGPARPR